VGDHSPLWGLLDEALGQRAKVPASHQLWPLLEAMIRPAVMNAQGQLVSLRTGVPTGSPIQPVICNLYLTPLDRALEQLPGGFYSRYGDDFLFAHHDHRVARRAVEIIDREVDSLALTIKEEKRLNLYLTKPGRASTDWPETKPAPQLDYLGCRISFDGIIGLKKTKARDLLAGMRSRLASTSQILADLSVKDRATVMCQVVNRMLDPLDPLCHRAAQLLRHVVNDRQQLRHLDYLIALDLAQAISGVRGVRSFRRVRYRDLRERWGLRSLVVERNR
jgi:hypothetical protein